MTRRFGLVWAAAAALWLGGVMPATSLAQEPSEKQQAAKQPETKAADEEAPKSGPDTLKVDPGNGVTFSTADGNYSLNIGFFGQFRAQYLDRDEFRRADTNPSLPYRVENIGVQEPSFQTRRLRLHFMGNFYRPWMGYKLELDLADNDEGLREVFIPSFDTTGGATPSFHVFAGVQEQDQRTVKTRDFYIDLHPKSYANLRFGQFKVPLGRQELVSDYTLQMAARSIASDFFTPSRDRGFMFYGGTPTNKIQYRIGAFNGTGLQQGVNLDKSLAYVFRLTATNKGPYLDYESLIDAPDSFRLQGGFSWYQNRNTPERADPTVPIGNVDDTRVSGDVEFWWPHVNLIGEYFTRKLDVDEGFDLPQTCRGAFLAGRVSCDQSGYTVQAGWLVGKRHEVSARFSKIDFDQDSEKTRSDETTLNYTCFLKGHAVRWSTSYSIFNTQVNAAGSSGFNVQALQNDFNLANYTGLDDDHNTLITTQFQFSF
ncbi:MAG TPA: porin [Patescibacteria group bacterium]|nr:porin [Patescibacteria group bacterium]